MPKIFTTIDQLMKQRFAGQHTEAFVSGLPGGVFEYSEHWVESRPLAVQGHTSSCFIRGKFDTVVRFDDGGFGVVDFKTSARNSEHIPLYARQLHAYACALEQAAPGRLALSPVRRPVRAVTIARPPHPGQRAGSPLTPREAFLHHAHSFSLRCRRQNFFPSTAFKA